jgi:hypothetical protein
MKNLLITKFNKILLFTAILGIFSISFYCLGAYHQKEHFKRYVKEYKKVKIGEISVSLDTLAKD